MSVVYENVKIGLERNGETKYLSDVVVDGENVSYQLSEQGQVWPGAEASVILNLLQKAEPDNNFLVLNGDN